MSFHAALTDESLHTPFRWIWADSAARTAEVVTTDDVDKVGLQLDTMVMYYLEDTTPTWTDIGAASGSLALNDLSDVDAASPSDGEVLAYNSISGNWEAATASSSSHTVSDAATNSISTAVELYHETSGIPTDGFGTAIDVFAHDSGNNDVKIGALKFDWAIVDAATQMSIQLLTSGNYQIGGMIQAPGLYGPDPTNLGEGAVDFQTYRSNSNQTAQGNYSSLLGGRLSRVTGNYSGILAGKNHVVAGDDSAVIGSADVNIEGVKNAIGGARSFTGDLNSGYIGVFGSYQDTFTNVSYGGLVGGLQNQIQNSDRVFFGGLQGATVNYVSRSSIIASGNATLTGYDAASDINYSSILNAFNSTIQTYSGYRGFSNGIFGGNSNVISSLNTDTRYSNIGNGTNNLIRDQRYGTILNGFENTIDYSGAGGSAYNTILNGKNHLISQKNFTTVLGGRSCTPTHIGEVVANSGVSFGVADGDLQGTLQQIVSKSVTHASTAWSTLAVDGGTTYLTFPTNTVITFHAKLVGTDGTNDFSFILEGAFRTGVSGTLLNSSVTIVHRDDTDYEAQVVADSTGTNTLDFQVRTTNPISGTPAIVSWVCQISYAQVKHA